MERELGEVFDAIDAFVSGEGGRPAKALVEDSTVLSRYSIETDRVAEALRDVDVLTRAGASVTLAVNVAGSAVLFTSGPTTAGRWKLSGDLAEIGWSDDVDAESVETAAVVQHWRSSSVQASASVEILLDKGRWSGPIAAAVGSTVWVGGRLSGFIHWLSVRPPESTLGTLFSDGGALVLLRDWLGEAVRLGPNLTLAGLDFRSSDPASKAPWPGAAEAWQRRALKVEVDQCPQPLLGVLTRALGWSAVLLLAEESSSDEAQPDRNATTRWRLPAVVDAPAGLPSVVALARWVSSEPSATRLAIARSLAARRLPNPFTMDGVTTIIEAAEIAYRQTVDSSVHAALVSQLELEQSFRSIDRRGVHNDSGAPGRDS